MTYVPIAPDGQLMKATPAPLSATLMALLQTGVQRMADAWPRQMMSAYCVGSVARGTFRPQLSDLNLIAVLDENSDVDLVPQDWLRPAERAITAQSAGLVRDCSITLYPYSYVFRTPEEYSPGACLLLTEGRLLWGNDLAPELPDYSWHDPALRQAIANDSIVDFGYQHEEIGERLGQDLSAGRWRGLARRLARLCLWTGAALLLEEIGALSRELATCAADRQRLVPADAAVVAQLLEWSYAPPSDPAALRELWGGYAEGLRQRCEAWLDEHNPERWDFWLFDEEA